jgi:hypothetical protein
LLLRLTDELIEGTIDAIAGFIVAKVARERSLPLDVVMQQFIASNTYVLLSNQETGLYWDSVPATLDMFYAELADKTQAAQ